jgi:hypothetical protein
VHFSKQTKWQVSNGNASFVSYLADQNSSASLDFKKLKVPQRQKYVLHKITQQLIGLSIFKPVANC